MPDTGAEFVSALRFRWLTRLYDPLIALLLPGERSGASASG